MKKNDFRNKCYECKHREELTWSAHSMCNAKPTPIVKGDEQGKKNGWFGFPVNFDPVWLLECNSFESKA